MLAVFCGAVVRLGGKRAIAGPGMSLDCGEPQLGGQAMIRVTIWNEFLAERHKEHVARVYPRGIHEAIAEGLQLFLGASLSVQYAFFDQPDHGLSEALLSETDVLLWWGHEAHERVCDSVVNRVQERVWQGMGLIVLHSGHASKIFRRLMGTGCMLRWREAGERERLWVVAPGHPIAEGVGEYFELPASEMYGEFFDIPPPDELVFVSWFQGGEVFRSGCVFYRGRGRVFYFSPGHETYPIYYDRNVRRVLANAVQWSVTKPGAYCSTARKCEPLEPLSG